MASESDWHAMKQNALRKQVESSPELKSRHYAKTSEVCELIRDVS
jgi:hypothetical protein